MSSNTRRVSSSSSESQPHFHLRQLCVVFPPHHESTRTTLLHLHWYSTIINVCFHETPHGPLPHSTDWWTSFSQSQVGYGTHNLPRQSRGVPVFEGRKYVHPRSGGIESSWNCAFYIFLAPMCLVRLGRFPCYVPSLPLFEQKFIVQSSNFFCLHPVLIPFIFIEIAQMLYLKVRFERCTYSRCQHYRKQKE